MSNDEISKEYKLAAESMSFYNAAEGYMWRQEGVARARARDRLQTAAIEMEKAGIEKPKGYLI